MPRLAQSLSRTLRSVLAMATIGVAGVAGTLAIAGTASAAPELVKLNTSHPMGTIIVVNKERKLYYVLKNGRAIRYPVAIGTPDNQWTGSYHVQSKAENPSWSPPWNPGYTVPGGPGNPLGARALYLGWSLYRIHGTNAPGSIGTAASHGCIRMFNEDVKDLYERVHIGAPVHVVDSLEDNS